MFNLSAATRRRAERPRPSVARRLEIVADFLRAECLAEVERGARLVPVPDDLGAAIAGSGCD